MWRCACTCKIKKKKIIQKIKIREFFAKVLVCVCGNLLKRLTVVECIQKKLPS